MVTFIPSLIHSQLDKDKLHRLMFDFRESIFVLKKVKENFTTLLTKAVSYDKQTLR